MAFEAADSLVRALQEHNPWWAQGTDAFSLPARERSDFYPLARPDADGSQVDDQQVLGLVGRRGVGKTTLLHQFVHHRIETGDAPERYLYLPFDADPLYQLRSDDQLQRAVRYYENRVLGTIGTDSPHYILLDDVHQIDHPHKPTIDGWGRPIGDMVEAVSGRHVVVTASAGIQVRRELEDSAVAAEAYAIRPILPEKFRDYIFCLHPDLEAGATRVSPTPLRTGKGSLKTALEEQSIDRFADQIRSEYEKVAHMDRDIQSQVVEYLAMGGIISYERDGVVESAAELTAADYTRLREDVRDALYQEIPGFESIQTIADLERLCALAARNRGRDPVAYQDLVDLFDVDRRTIADSYLPALEELFVLTGVTEYDNRRPRSVRLYLRDTGLLNALTGADPSIVRTDFDREADLARVAGFDHTMRFAYGIAAEQGAERVPSVRYWRGRDGEVDYVFEVAETPVPVGLAYRPRERAATRDAVREFRQTYDAPLGVLVVGDTVRGENGVEHLGDGIVQLPFWLYLLLC